MESRRELIKGPIRPPERKTKALSCTQAPASKDEISVRNKEGKGREGEVKAS